MEKTSPKSNKSGVKKWLRIIHRDLGFLMVGICLVYAISGFLLNHMDGKDPAFKSVEDTFVLEKGLGSEELTVAWEARGDMPALKKIFKDGDTYYRLMLDGGVGLYNVGNGELTYEHHTKRQLIYWINKLHYNKVNGWTWMADFFAISLVFFAVSGLFIVSKKYGLRGRGKWYVIAGFCIPILYLVFN